MLKIIPGTRKETNKVLMEEAINNTPSLIIDCCSAADPHRYYGQLNEETLEEMHIIEVEMLYKYRDVVRQLPYIIRLLKPKIVIITSTKYLFNYQNEKENKLIHGYCNNKLKAIAKDIEILKAE